VPAVLSRSCRRASPQKSGSLSGPPPALVNRILSRTRRRHRRLDRKNTYFPAETGRDGRPGTADKIAILTKIRRI
jgi:hypothetical protein